MRQSIPSHHDSSALTDFSSAQSAPDTSRRHSLPPHHLPASLWSTNAPRKPQASLVSTDDSAHGEHSLDEATIAHRISALRQLNGATATRTNHRYAKSTGAPHSTFSQPVIVRTYSGSRPASRSRSEKQSGFSEKEKKGKTNGKVELPPLEAFTFKGIMDHIQSSVSEDLERIAEICARSRYSLSNQYEVHMPPHGGGEGYLVHVAARNATPHSHSHSHSHSQSHQSVHVHGGPTLQAIESDDESLRLAPQRRRGGRRVRSMAQGTLETIMSSSKSSEEEKAKKESAATLAENVRGRAARKAAAAAAASGTEDPSQAADQDAATDPRPKQSRSRSATFASMIIDSAQKHSSGTLPLTTTQLPTTTSLVSEPARPQTSISISASLPNEQDTSSLFNAPTLTSPTLIPSTLPPHPQLPHHQHPELTRNPSRTSTLRPEPESKPSVLNTLGSWLPWGRSTSGFSDGIGLFRGGSGGVRTNIPGSHAEGSLRELLRVGSGSADVDGGDRKGKGVDRGC